MTFKNMLRARMKVLAEVAYKAGYIDALGFTPSEGDQGIIDGGFGRWWSTRCGGGLTGDSVYPLSVGG